MRTVPNNPSLRALLSARSERAICAGVFCIGTHLLVAAGHGTGPPTATTRDSCNFSRAGFGVNSGRGDSVINLTFWALLGLPAVQQFRTDLTQLGQSLRTNSASG